MPPSERLPLQCGLPLHVPFYYSPQLTRNRHTCLKKARNAAAARSPPQMTWGGPKLRNSATASGSNFKSTMLVSTCPMLFPIEAFATARSPSVVEPAGGVINLPAQGMLHSCLRCLITLTLVQGLAGTLARTSVVGRQPRGNAVVREARRTVKVSGKIATPHQTARLRAEAMDNLGLNINNYWTLRSGLIEESIPTPKPSDAALAKQVMREEAEERADKRRMQAEQRLQQRVRHPTEFGGGTNAKAAARLCAALEDARRHSCRIPSLLRQAESLLAILERAAAEEYVRAQANEDVHSHNS